MQRTFRRRHSRQLCVPLRIGFGGGLSRSLVRRKSILWAVFVSCSQA